MTNFVKRVISGLLFGAGLAFSLYGCAASAAATFSIGIHDTFPEIVAIALCLPGFFLVSILGFWFRKIAGGIMMALSVIFFLGMLMQGIHDNETLSSDLAPLFRVCVPVFLLGAFALSTGLAGWPEVIQRGRQQPKERLS
ncbi:MAG TPA: hypothetical protein VMU71_01495 [Terracidiphilus sp.]|nr:hypothetical protein [Terracidiphilus sp.]